MKRLGKGKNVEYFLKSPSELKTMTKTLFTDLNYIAFSSLLMKICGGKSTNVIFIFKTWQAL